MPKTVYSVREVARVLDVGPMTVYKLLKGGDLKSTQVGGQFRVTAVTLRRYLRLGPTAEIVLPPEPEEAGAEA